MSFDERQYSYLGVENGNLAIDLPQDELADELSAKNKPTVSLEGIKDNETWIEETRKR